ncbi:response regulator transcription factor [Niabella drilacis]|uniref:Two component transcriptional regulator, LuxR family n=1 Tax=Niabella drilacis (strain DSM 25811 / CCM 8410 / CCUG 62505 / LMG 26954 / E90) TaxID=1285928 RepID=A0A1G6U8Z4_NIADE|nr:response regulator transcription factor [Niabella drilacis]SDD37015.1 two component transcriptional regulator, LuxR family [Niabella drilacis]
MLQPVSIAIVDDHAMLRKGLANILNEENDFSVILEADNGRRFIELLEREKLQPDVVLLDVHMPEMNGYETALWIEQNLPLAKVLVLSMNDDEEMVIKMLRCGAKGYILKDADPPELYRAIRDINANGYHLSRLVTGKLLFTMNRSKEQPANPAKLSAREKEFLVFCCSDLTYKEIADRMFVSARTIDGYRDSLFEKLEQKSRVGLVLYAIRHDYFRVR